MKKSKSNMTEHPALRHRSEERLGALRPERDVQSIEADEKRLLHELQVHQVELEMQNEELRRAQLEKEKSEQKFINLYEFAPGGYFTLNEKGMISELNLAAARFLGIERKYLINRLFSDFIQPKYKDAFSLHIEALLASSTRQTCEVVLKRNDGRSFFHARLDSIVVEVKGERSIYVVVTDITERKQAEEQLRHSQKMEAIGTLAGGIAHDFNNILAAIIGFTEIVMDDVRDDRSLVEKNLQNILKSAMRAKELVKQILAFSRKTTRERTLLSLSPLIKETVHLLRASIPTTIEIKVVLNAGSDIILADAGGVQQILMNLAANASLAMEEKGGIMEISLVDVDCTPDSQVLEAEMTPGEYVQLMVKDTGTGMSPQVMRRVFEPFFTTRDVSKGTGMGLAIVYGIVKDLQGTVTVQSEPGVGSTFRVLLPKARPEAQEEPLQADEVPRGMGSILFIDDEEMLFEWGQATLERLGYTVTARTDPTEALNLFYGDPSRFDLVITDQTMPKLTGLRLARALIKVRPDIPIILCTGHSDTVSPEIAKEAGIRQFLNKPLSRKDLAQAVRKALDTKPDG